MAGRGECARAPGPSSPSPCWPAGLHACSTHVRVRALYPNSSALPRPLQQASATERDTTCHVRLGRIATASLLGMALPLPINARASQWRRGGDGPCVGEGWGGPGSGTASASAKKVIGATRGSFFSCLMFHAPPSILACITVYKQLCLPRTLRFASRRGIYLLLYILESALPVGGKAVTCRYANMLHK